MYVKKLLDEMDSDKRAELLEEYLLSYETDLDKIQIETMADYIDDAKLRYQNWGKMQGLKTGFSTLDDMTKGLVGGELIVIAGRTSNGKTMLGANIAYNVAKNGTVMFVTMEQTKVELTQRFMSISGQKPNEPLTDEFAGISAKIALQKNDELSWKNIDGLIETAKQELNCSLVVIDHLHYFTRELENVAEDLGRITKEFKKNAIRHDIPIILLSHVRKIDKRNEPSIEDLRGSSYIGQDADIVLMMMKKAETNEYKCIIEKNRNRGYNVDEVYFRQDGMKLHEQ